MGKRMKEQIKGKEAEEKMVKVVVRDSELLTMQMISACMKLLLEEYGITKIRKSDYLTIGDNAFFLTHSNQVTKEEDINLDAAYECFNDTLVSAEMIEEKKAVKKVRR